jgi:hypothetical protein
MERKFALLDFPIAGLLQTLHLGMQKIPQKEELEENGMDELE